MVEELRFGLGLRLELVLGNVFAPELIKKTIKNFDVSSKLVAVAKL